MFPDIVGSGFERHLRETVDKQEVTTFVEYDPGLSKWFSVRAYPSSELPGRLFPGCNQLREQQEQLALLEAAVARSNDIFLITEANFIDKPGPYIVYANDAITKLTGYSPKELVGKSPRIFQGPATSRAELDRIRSTSKPDRPSAPKSSIMPRTVRILGGARHRPDRRRQGTRHPFRVRAARYHRAEGRSGRTRHQRAALQDGGPAQRGYRLGMGSGLQCGLVERRQSRPVLHERGRAKQLAVLDGANSSGRSRQGQRRPEGGPQGDRSGDWSAEYRLQRVDGSYSKMVARSAVIRNDLGKAVRIVGSAVDVTEQRELEERVRSPEESYRTLFEAAPYAVIVEERYNSPSPCRERCGREAVHGWSREEISP